jgi:hypothetical protein
MQAIPVTGCRVGSVHDELNRWTLVGIAIDPSCYSLGEAANTMSYIITGTDSAGALPLKRDTAAAAIKKAVELMGDGAGKSASQILMATA